MTDEELYEKCCAGCPNEKVCHDCSIVCDRVLQLYEETKEPIYSASTWES